MVRVCRSVETLYKQINAISTLHNEELHYLFCSANIIRMIKSKEVRWEGHVVHKAEEVCVQYFGKARRKETTRKT
jgi:hypothetical protein